MLQSVEDGLPVSENLSVKMFRKVYREANNDKTGKYGVVEGNDIVPNSQPTSKEIAYKKYKNTPAHGNTNPTLSKVSPETKKALLPSGSEERVADDQVNLVSAVVQFDKAEIDKAETAFTKGVLERMKVSPDLGARIAYYQKTNPSVLDNLSKSLLNVVRKGLGLPPID